MGYALVFNNKSFDQPVQTRSGSDHDVQRLKNVFYKFDFRVKIVRDPKLQDIQNNMKLLLKENLNTSLGIIVVVMTHGTQFDIVLAKDKQYSIQNLIINSEVFQRFPDLPKIVITQACKAGLPMDTTITSPRSLNIQNVLRFDSTFEGFLSFRLSDGSPFIQRLCKYLEEDGFSLSFAEIADKVQREFKTKDDVGPSNLNRQYPTLTFMPFSKPLYLGERFRKIKHSCGDFVI